jgi:hypothetical protein
MSDSTLDAQEIHRRLQRMVWAKQTWINDHCNGTNARSLHEIKYAREDLEVLKGLCDGYAKRVVALNES